MELLKIRDLPQAASRTSKGFVGRNGDPQSVTPSVIPEREISGNETIENRGSAAPPCETIAVKQGRPRVVLRRASSEGMAIHSQSPRPSSPKEKFRVMELLKIGDLPKAASRTSKSFVGKYGDPQSATVDRSLTSVPPLAEILIQG